MSTLQVANLHLESSANNRIQNINSTSFAVVAGSTEVMRFVSGDVGIGTTSPDTKLQVSGTSGSTQFRAGTDTNGYFEVNAFDSNPVYCVVAGTTATAGVFGTQTNIPTIFYTNNTERMRIDTSGNLQFNSGYGSVATAYGCRAWVNFDGDPVTIRADGGVTSITDNGVGLYTINFDVTMPDVNYAVIGSVGSGSRVAQGIQQGTTAPATGSCQVMTGATSAAAFTAADYDYIFVAFFR